MKPDTKRSYAVIFDMDGVLVDSYRAHFKSWQTITQTDGVPMTEADFARTFGRTSREVIAELWRDRQLSEADVTRRDRQKEAEFRRVVAEHVPAMHGAVELVGRLHDAGLPLAVGSSAPPENVDVVLDGLGIRDWFRAVVTGSDVVRGKPDPQIFLTAAERLGIPPGRCVVIEDAPVGVEAARRAGMAVVALLGKGRTRESLAAADRVVESLDQLTPEGLRRAIDDNDG